MVGGGVHPSSLSARLLLFCYRIFFGVGAFFSLPGLELSRPSRRGGSPRPLALSCPNNKV